MVQNELSWLLKMASRRSLKLFQELLMLALKPPPTYRPLNLSKLKKEKQNFNL